MDAMNRSSDSHLMSGGRYPALRAIAILYMIGACLSVIAGIIGVIYAFGWGHGNWLNRLALASMVVGGTFIAVISMLAIAEVLKLFIDIEHSCRAMAQGELPLTKPIATVESVSTDGHRSRIVHFLDEETAEGALMRGH
jgi:hypothetical protein